MGIPHRTILGSAPGRTVARKTAQRGAGVPRVLPGRVEGDSGGGEQPEVRAAILGWDPGLPAVLVYAHTNDRNAGGGNNLTGVGCTLEVARVLNGLIQSQKLARPRRT